MLEELSDLKSNCVAPPNDEKAERGVLGCILLSSEESLGSCISRLPDSRAFYDLRHRAIYEAVLELQAANLQVDTITLHSKLKSLGKLDSVGGIVMLNELADEVPSAANLPAYLDTVHDCYVKRQIIRSATKAIEKCQAGEKASNELLDELEEQVLAIRPRASGSGSDAKSAVQAAMMEMEELYNRQGSIGGIETGFIDFDRIHDGLHQDEMIVIGAFPGTGKTVLAMEIASFVAIEKQKNVVVFSLEMKAAKLMSRALCSRAKVNIREISRGNVNDRDFRRLSKASIDLANSKIELFDKAGVTVQEIRAEARRIHRKTPISLIVIDYIQLVTGKGDNREGEIANISRNLKWMAGELNCTVIALSQLNDDGKLRESRSMGMDADTVAILSPVDKEATGPVSELNLSIRKQRNGPAPANMGLTFFKEFTHMESKSHIDPADYRNEPKEN